MTALNKTATLGTLGLPEGDHWVKFHVEEDCISFEVAASLPKDAPPVQAVGRKPTGFVEKWGGTVKKQEDGADEWLTHINAKHVK